MPSSLLGVVLDSSIRDVGKASASEEIFERPPRNRVPRARVWVKVELLFRITRIENMADPVVMATWPFGQTAVEKALPLLLAGKPALDAALAGAQAVEDDPSVRALIASGCERGR